MKTKKKVIELQSQGLNPKEISNLTNTSIQNVYKHIREFEQKKTQNTTVNLSEDSLNKLAELIFNKLKENNALY